MVKSTNVFGIACILIATLVFTLNDVGIKFLSGDYSLHQIVFLRSLLAMAVTLGIIIPLEGGFHLLKTKHLRVHLLRGFFVVTANMSFFTGLAAIPLAEATAIFFISPLLTTVFSVIFLSEKVGRQRWIAVLAGLVGAVVMLRPGTQAFQFATLLPVIAACSMAALHITTRKIGQTEKASTMAFYVMLIFIVVSLAIGIVAGDGRYSGHAHPSIEFLTRAWVMPPTTDLMIMGAIGLLSAVGGYMITQAYRLCEVALVAPFEYLALVLAIFWGISIFDEWPDTIAWIGMGLILGAGLFIFWREAMTRKPALRDSA